MVDKKHQYFYDKSNNSIFKILHVIDDKYHWLCVAGNNESAAWWSGGYNRLFISESIVFGDLETLKVLYVKK